MKYLTILFLSLSACGATHQSETYQKEILKLKYIIRNQNEEISAMVKQLRAIRKEIKDQESYNPERIVCIELEGEGEECLKFIPVH